MKTKWTRQDSADLDDWAAAAYRNPLQRNEKLWQLLEPDRLEAPRRRERMISRPSHCIDCRTEFGYVQHKCRGLCSNCWRHRTRSGIPLPPLIYTGASRDCVKCAVPLRTRDMPADGRAVHAGRGMCQGCYKASRRTLNPRKPRPDKCERCDHPVRPSNKTRADMPGTIRYQGNGLCTTCAEKKC